MSIIFIHNLSFSYWGAQRFDRTQQHSNQKQAYEPSTGTKIKDMQVNTSTCASKVNLYHSGSIVRLGKGPNDEALVWSFVISNTVKHAEPRSHKTHQVKGKR